MSEKQDATSVRAGAADVPLVKRLRGSALSSAAEEQDRQCQELFNALKNFEDEDGRLVCQSFFRYPSKKCMPEYHKVIKNPMDLAMIHQKVKENEYESVERMMDDVRVMVENAKHFYEKGSQEFSDACEVWDRLLRARSRQLESLENDSELSNRSGDSSPAPSSQSFRSISPNHLSRGLACSSVATGLEPAAPSVLEDLLATVLLITSDDGRCICEPFKVASSRKLRPDYYSCVEEPMDLRTMARKIRDRTYKCINDMEADMHLLCINTLLFHEEQSVLAQDAKAMQKSFTLRKNELTSTMKRGIARKQMEKNALLIDELLNCQSGPIDFPHVEEDSDDDETDGCNAIRSMYNQIRFWPSGVKDEVYFEPFLRLPDRITSPDYYEQMSKPISFYAINKNIKESRYGSVASLLSDMLLMASNALQCNAEGSTVHAVLVKATKLKELAAERAAQLRPSLHRNTALSPPHTVDVGQRSEEDVLGVFKDKMLQVYNAVVTYQDAAGRLLSAAFMEKPSRKVYPDYYQVIPDPIDLRMIKASIDGDKYLSSNALALDFELLFENAKHYNEDGSKIFRDANTLADVFSQAMAAVFSVPLELPRPVANSRSRRVARVAATDRSYGRKRSNSYGSDSPPLQISAKIIKLEEGDSKLLTLYNCIREYTDSQGRVLSSMFIKLPSKTEYPDYYEIIRKPMDLQKIYSRIVGCHYDGLSAMIADLALMFDNACKYNDPDSVIYKDALTLQRLMLQKKAELQDEEPHGAVDVQEWVQEMMVNVFLAVSNHKDEANYCYSDSLYELAVDGDDQSNLLTLDRVKRNLDKKRYRRLDRFQQDMFTVFRNARLVHACDSQAFMDSVELQSFFIKTRDEACKHGDLLQSPALAYAIKDLNAEVQADREKSSGRELAKGSIPEKQEGDQDMDSVTIRGTAYKVGDFVYVKPIDGRSEPHIMRLKRIWKTDDDGGGGGNTLAAGIWFYRPWETYHLVTRKFLQQVAMRQGFADPLAKCSCFQEVFCTDFQDNISTQRIMGKCYVMFVKSFFKYKPSGFADEDVYVCEWKYLGRTRHFRKIKTWDVNPEDNGVQLEERPEPLAPVRVPSVFVSGNAPVGSAKAHGSDEDWDSETETSVLEMERCLMPLPGCKDSDVVEYEQASDGDLWVKLGDHVYVTTDEMRTVIFRVEKIWRCQGEMWISGVTFVRPADVQHQPTRLFYKKEVFAADYTAQYRLSQVSGRCSVLLPKGYGTYRITEITEADVYVCESNAVTTEDGKLSVADGADGRYRLKIFQFVNDVLEDEVYHFRKALHLDKEPLAISVKPVVSYDQSSEPASPSMDTFQQDIGGVYKDAAIIPRVTARSKSGYILFSAVVRKRIMTENPNCSFGDISRIVGSEWKKLSDDEKKRYEEEAQRVAEERAKADVASGGRVQLLPGQIRVFCCRWRDCDYQFDSLDMLNEHVIGVHTSQIVKVGEDQYVCLWSTCSKYKKDGKPFPSLPRLHRHIKEKHLPTSLKCMYPQNCSKNYVRSVNGTSTGLTVSQTVSVANQPSSVAVSSASPLVQSSTPAMGSVYRQPVGFGSTPSVLRFAGSAQDNVHKSLQSNVNQSVVAMYQGANVSHSPQAVPPAPAIRTPVQYALAAEPVVRPVVTDPGRNIVQATESAAAATCQLKPCRVKRVLISEDYAKYLTAKYVPLTRTDYNAIECRRRRRRNIELLLRSCTALLKKNEEFLVPSRLLDACEKYCDRNVPIIFK